MRQIKICESITQRTGAVNRYLQDVNALPMISTEEEAELSERIHNGDEEAFIKLVTANLRFVVSVAKQYQHNGIELCDIINEGNLGLMKAARRFDATRGFKFISYAVWWIRQSIMQAISDQSRMVRLPLNQVSMLCRLNREKADFMQEHEREPSDEELSAITGFDDNRIHDAKGLESVQMSLDASLGDEEKSSLIDILPDESIRSTDSVLMNESLHDDIIRTLTVLSERERRVIILSFGIGTEGMTLEDIGNRMNLTRERVRQIRMNAIRKLKKTGIKRKLKQYLS